MGIRYNRSHEIKLRFTWAAVFYVQNLLPDSLALKANSTMRIEPSDVISAIYNSYKLALDFSRRLRYTLRISQIILF